MSPLGSPGNLLDQLDVPPFAADALCAQTDPEAFYPEHGESTTAAKTVCAACPVRAACLDYALRRHERHGIWGGLTARQRRTLHAQRRRTPEQEAA